MLLAYVYEPLIIVGALVTFSCLIPHFLYNKCPHCGKQLGRTKEISVSIAVDASTKSSSLPAWICFLIPVFPFTYYLIRVVSVNMLAYTCDISDMLGYTYDIRPVVSSHVEIVVLMTRRGSESQ